MKKFLQTCCFVLTVSVISFSCKKDSDSNTEPPTGTVKGKVVSANNTTPVKRAMVFVQGSSKIYKTFTDANGDFSLQAPIGVQKLHIQSGDGSMFRSITDVTITENQTTTLTTKAKLSQVAKLGFVTGTYDKIEDIIVNSLGYAALPITNADLHSFAALSQYDAIFLNCGGSISLDATINTNLANYVANGGSLYASDWAVSYLIGTNIYGSVCPYVRPEGFIPDATLCTTRTGTTQTITGCNVVSTDLSTYLNKTLIDLKYDLPNWEQINIADPNFWETMVVDASNGLPLLIRTNKFTNPTAGTLNVGVSNPGFVTICHTDANGTSTITVSTADLQSHLAHGDKVGSCESTPNSGRIYYTTFHNENGGVINNDTKDILQYMILNL